MNSLTRSLLTSLSYIANTRAKGEDGNAPFRGTQPEEITTKRGGSFFQKSKDPFVMKADNMSVLSKEPTNLIRNYTISCEDVTLVAGVLWNMDKTDIVHSDSFFCIRTAGDNFGIKLTNLWPNFEKEWNAARAEGPSRLRITGGVINGNRLTLPKNEETIVREWQTTPSSSRKLNRNLAQNQIGSPNVLVFRVTVNHNGLTYTPTNSAVDVSAKLFGSVGQTGVTTLKQQYASCSNNKLNFMAATDGNIAFDANGVIDITVTTGGTGAELEGFGGVTSLDNALLLKANDLGIEEDDFSFIIFHYPTGVTTDNSIDWIGHASNPGKYSYFNDKNIMDIETLMHEIAHNFGLTHSSQIGDTDSVEYGDRTGYMGLGSTPNNNERKCFNGAKSFELQWYNTSPNRVVSINPTVEESFEGKLIGVNDYAASASGHTLIVEIASPHESIAPLYLAYNKAEGINEDTYESIDMVTVTQGRSREKSYLIASIDSNGGFAIPGYHNGRALIVTVGPPDQDGDIDFVPVTVDLEDVPCSSDADCTVDPNGPTCATATCISNMCSYSTIFGPGCCGDGFCDISETCSSCPQDCNKTHCDVVDHQTSGVFTESVYGIMFEVEALKEDVSIYEIEIELYDNSKFRAEVVAGYDSSPVGVETIYNELISPSMGKATIILASPQLVKTGSRQAFYIKFDVGSYLKFGLSSSLEPHGNDDIDIKNVDAKELDGSRPDFDGTPYHEFVGTIRYTFPSALYCEVDSECNSISNIPSCASQKCVSNVCSYFAPFTQACCGDGYCDTSETCSSCPQDCDETNCSALDYPTSLVFSSGVYGIMFEVEALNGDLGIYEIEIELNDSSQEQIATVLTGYPTPTKSIFNGIISPLADKATLALSSPQLVTSGSRQVFYIKFEEGNYLKFGVTSSLVLHGNSDIKVENVAAKSRSGSTIKFGDNFFNFGGVIRYTYISSQTSIPPSSPTQSPFAELTSSPTPNPILSPTTSPTAVPTNTPTTNPTTAPTQSPTSDTKLSPTTSPIAVPTNAPTISPTMAPTQSPTSDTTSSPPSSPAAVPTNAPTKNPSTTTSPFPNSSPTNAPISIPTSATPASPTTSEDPSTSPVSILDPTSNPVVSPTSSSTASPTAAPCGNLTTPGESCSANNDCTTGLCQNDTCKRRSNTYCPDPNSQASRCQSGTTCLSNNRCEPKGNPGHDCSASYDCNTNICEGSRCKRRYNTYCPSPNSPASWCQSGTICSNLNRCT